MLTPNLKFEQELLAHVDPWCSVSPPAEYHLPPSSPSTELHCNQITEIEFWITLVEEAPHNPKYSNIAPLGEAPRVPGLCAKAVSQGCRVPYLPLVLTFIH